MNREKRRAAAWRAEQDKLESGDKHEIEAADKAKTFIDAKGKRKVAFIKKEVSNFLVIAQADLTVSSTLNWTLAMPTLYSLTLILIDQPT
jgi:ribosomal protein S25